MMKTKKFLFVMVAVMAMSAPGVVAMAGEGSSDALWNDPSEYLAAKQRDASAAAVSDVLWNDPSEYYAAMQREASTAAVSEAFPSFAGSYGALKLAARDAGVVAASEAFWSSAGSFGALKLAAGDAKAVAVSGALWNDPSEYYAAMQREANTTAEGGTCEAC